MCRLASFMGVAKLAWWHPHPWWRSGVFSLRRYGCWQWTMAAGVAWQLSVWCGTTSGDGACGIDIVRRLGLQRIAVGGSALLDYFDVIHRRKDGASDYLVLLARRRESFARVEQRGDVGIRLGHGCSLEALGSGATPPLSRWQLLKWICDMECCGGRGEAPACSVYSSRRRECGGIQRLMWRGSRAFVPLRDCEAACERYGSGVIILSGGV